MFKTIPAVRMTGFLIRSHIRDTGQGQRAPQRREGAGRAANLTQADGARASRTASRSSRLAASKSSLTITWEAVQGAPWVRQVSGEAGVGPTLSKQRVVRENSISSLARNTRREISSSDSVPRSVRRSRSAPNEGGATHTQYGRKSERATIAFGSGTALRDRARRSLCDGRGQRRAPRRPARRRRARRPCPRLRAPAPTRPSCRTGGRRWSPIR